MVYKQCNGKSKKEQEEQRRRRRRRRGNRSNKGGGGGETGSPEEEEGREEEMPTIPRAPGCRGSGRIRGPAGPGKPEAAVGAVVGCALCAV